jgi:hypothetical protein
MPNVEQGKDISHIQTTGAATGDIDTENVWVVGCVTKARQNNASVTDSVSAIVTHQLRGLLSERALTQAELTTIAKRLIEEMNSVPLPTIAGIESLE